MTSASSTSTTTSASSTGSTSSGCNNPGAAGSGTSCSGDGDCCSNHCEVCACQAFPKLGDPCPGGYCSFGTCGTSGTCECRADGAACTSSEQCCSVECTNGACDGGGTRPAGAPCSENRHCKYALCTGGTCAEISCGTTCAAPGDYCANGGADGCCSGVCDAQGSLCICVESGGSCTDDKNCCGLSCNGGTCG
jgi:hypothetical protein